jgi:uncharacterized membrane protein
MVEEIKLTLKNILNNFFRFLGLLLVIALLLFVPAGTFDYWQAWAFLAIFGLALITFLGYGMLHDPNLLKEHSQKAKNVKY